MDATPEPHTSLRLASWRVYLPLGLPIAVSVGYLAYVARTSAQHFIPYFIVCACVAAVVYGLALASRRLSDRAALIVILVAVHVTLLLLRQLLQFSLDIGDSRWVVEFAAKNTVFPRWLGISYLTAGTYGLGKTLSMTSGAFAWAFPTPESFVRFFLGSVILAQSVHLLLTTRHLRSIAFVVLSPFGLLFLAGHIEIYMVIALYVVQCCEALRRSENGPVLLGVLIGGLGVLYYGAWHLCLGLLAIAFLRRPTHVFALLASFGLTLLIGIDLLWPGDLQNFAVRLNSYTPTGLRLLVPEYHLRTGPGMFWKGGFLFSETHLAIVGKALFAGLTPFFVVVTAALLQGGSFREQLARTKPFHRTHLGWVSLSLLALVFVLLMIPRLGIERDIDLFAISCVALVYVGASFVEPLLRAFDLKMTVAAYVLYSALTFGLLLF